MYSGTARSACPCVYLWVWWCELASAVGMYVMGSEIRPRALRKRHVPYDSPRVCPIARSISVGSGCFCAVFSALLVCASLFRSVVRWFPCVRSQQLRSSAMKGCTFCGAQVKNKVECGLCGAKACKQCETAKMVIAGGGACCRKHSPGWQAETAAPIQTQTQR